MNKEAKEKFGGKRIVIITVVSILSFLCLIFGGYSIYNRQSLNGDYVTETKNTTQLVLNISGKHALLTVKADTWLGYSEDTYDMKVDKKNHKLINKTDKNENATYRKNGKDLVITVNDTSYLLKKQSGIFKAKSNKTKTSSKTKTSQSSSSHSTSSSSSKNNNSLTKEKVEDFATKLVGKTLKFADDSLYDFYSDYDDDAYVMLDAKDENGEFISDEEGYKITEIMSVTDDEDGSFTINVLATK